MNLSAYYWTVSGTGSCLQTCYLCSDAVGIYLLVVRKPLLTEPDSRPLAPSWLSFEKSVLAAPWHYHAYISAAWHLNSLLCCSKSQQHLDFSLLLPFCHYFVVIFLTLFPQAKAALFFIAQFEIYLWQEGHRHVSFLLCVEQYSHNGFQIQKFV